MTRSQLFKQFQNVCKSSKYKVMQAIRLQQTIEKDGEIHLSDLPVVRGQEVEVIVLISPLPETKITSEDNKDAS